MPTRHPHARRTNWAASLSLVLCAGCAVIHPQVSWDPVNANDQKSAPLNTAIKYAREGQATYQSAKAQHNWTGGLIGLTVIAASASALGLGMTDTSEKAVIGVTVGGAGLGAAGAWIYTRDRNGTYSEGQEILGCAIKAVAPLSLGSREPVFRDAVHSLSCESSGSPGNGQCVRHALAAAIGEVERRLAAAGNGITPAENRIAKNAKTALVSARKAHSLAIELQPRAVRAERRMSAAADQLQTTVDRIRAQVDKAIEGTIPSLESARIAAGELAARVGALGEDGERQDGEKDEPAPAPPTDDDAPLQADGAKPPAQAFLDLADAAADLQRAESALRSTTSTLEGWIAEIGSPDVDALLAACNVSERVNVPLSIQPASPFEFTEGKPESRSGVIQGGRAPYNARLLADVEGVEIDQALGGGRRVSVSISDAAKAGTYTVHIVDGRGDDLFPKVRISAAAKPETDQEVEEEDEAAPSETDRLTIETNKRIQQKLCTAADGDLGGTNSDSRKQIREFQAEIGVASTGVLKESERTTLLGQEDCLPWAGNYYELRLARDRELGDKLKLIDSSLEGKEEIDAETREKIRERATAAGDVVRAQDEGELTRELIKELEQNS